MKILVTGSSNGIGRECALRYLSLGHDVVGIDEEYPTIFNPHYKHFKCDISDKESLPEIEDLEVIFNNAGKQNSSDDIQNNLRGTINVTEKYIKTSKILKSILFSASSSANSGQEFPEYVASKSGIVGYMKNVAIRLAPQKVVVNSISFGGVLTRSNEPVMRDEKLWNDIMKITPLKKWVSLEEAADWVMFLTLTNKSMSGQDILVDNGEKDLNPTFVWPDFSL